MIRADARRGLSGMVLALKSGSRWSECPEHISGPKATLDNHPLRWPEIVVRERILSQFAGLDGVPDRLCITGRCIKAHGTAEVDRQCG
jgi:hypothetical protein